MGDWAGTSWFSLFPSPGGSEPPCWSSGPLACWDLCSETSADHLASEVQRGLLEPCRQAFQFTLLPGLLCPSWSVLNTAATRYRPLPRQCARCSM